MNTARVFWRSLPEAWRRDAWRLSILLFLACSRVLYWRHYYPLVNTDTRRNSAASKLSLAHQKGLLCIGWRQAKNCNSTLFGIESIVPSLLDVPCDQPIPKGSTGVCELQTHNGTIIHAIHKACNYRHHPRAKYLTCNMAVDFLNFKHDAHAFREDPPMTMTQGSMSNGNDKRRGIVMSVYDDILVSAYAVIQVLREKNCTMPIELWSKPNEVKNSILFRELLKDPGITQRLIEDDSISGFMSKPYSLFHSVFDEVLLLDADSLPPKDATYLFDMPQFQDTGAIFFLDYWTPQNTVFHMTSKSLLWELLGISFVDEFEMESGQLLLDKTRSEAALNVLMFLARTYDQWIGPLWLAWGDKDLFRFAWRMTNTSFHYIQQPPSTAGFTTADVEVCGLTLVQHDPNGDPIFLHRNTVKLKEYDSLEKVWMKSQTFVGDNPLDQYRIQPSPVKGKKIKCYHPTPWSSKWFQTKNLIGTDIEAAEESLLKWAREALRISP